MLHTPDVTQTHAAADHLTLSLRCQVGAPADDLAVLSPSAEQSSTLQGAQGKHTAFVCFDWSNNLIGFCLESKVGKEKVRSKLYGLFYCYDFILHKIYKE